MVTADSPFSLADVSWAPMMLAERVTYQHGVEQAIPGAAEQ